MTRVQLITKIIDDVELRAQLAQQMAMKVAEVEHQIELEGLDVPEETMDSVKADIHTTFEHIEEDAIQHVTNVMNDSPVSNETFEEYARFIESPAYSSIKQLVRNNLLEVHVSVATYFQQFLDRTVAKLRSSKNNFDEME